LLILALVVDSQLERVVPRFLPFSTLGRLPMHPVLVKWYLRIPLFWLIFGKQYFIVASKKG
jgi:hypothetical protein